MSDRRSPFASDDAPPSPAPSARRVRLRRAAGWALRALVVLWFVAGGLMLAVRHVVMPAVGDFRSEIAAAASAALGVPVSIASIEGDWAGWRPRLQLAQLAVADAQGRPALLLPRVDATLAWSSVLRLKPHFHRLEISAPQLALSREADGRLLVAGLPVDESTEEGGEVGGGALDWLLAQGQIVVHDAHLSWTDRQRGAPELRLEQVEFRFDRRLGPHRFALRARPPQALASALEVRGELRRFAADAPLASAGRLYVALEHGDLGGWRPWLDYPLPLQGAGSVRLWIEADAGRGAEGARALSLTADVALEAVRTRLGEALPELDLVRLDGRLSAARTADGLEFGTRGLTLQTGDGLALASTDVALQLGQAGGGSVRANRLDFGALARLAAFLPLADEARARLAGFAPTGRLEALRLDWDGTAAAPGAWSLAAQFDGIGLLAREGLPGLGGLSGSVDGNERGGRFRLDGREVHLDLPAVFESTRLAFAALRADGGWSRREGRLEIALDGAEFENADAAGTASGRYWPEPGGAGEIDLQARLTRAEGTAVWRYLPRVVGRSTQDWVRSAIRNAAVPEARLRLRGRLADFPFRDGSGQFLVTIRVADGVLDYASGWPSIEGIHGEVRFEGPGMRIAAERGRIFGVALEGVVAEVPDLDVKPSELMTITGRAVGPTADFLRFVSASPVAARIGGFTDGMRAEGKGTLALRLAMPLRHIADTTVEGEYRLAGNRLWLVDALPPVEAAAGRIRFTADELSIPEVRGELFGAPLRVTARTAADGGVSFEAGGALGVAALGAGYDWPLLAHLSGTAAWTAGIRIARGATRVEFGSDLTGVVSSLPEPLNKGGAERWPLRVVVEHPGAGAPARLEVQLADRLRASLERGSQGWLAGRGGLALGREAGEAVRMAERGVMVAATLERLDVDAWRRALDVGGERDAEVPLPLAGVAMQAGVVRAFGQTLKAVNLRALADPGGWKARLDSDLAEGEFDWRDAGSGALLARFKRLSLGGDEDTAEAADGRDEAPPRQLPALDVVAERFQLRGLDLGRLEVFARNRAGLWQLERLALENADGRLGGSGQWQAAGRQQTKLDFRLETADVGRFSRRLGYADVVRGGAATLSGQLAWAGAPTRIDYATLDGSLKLEAGAGQFNKLEPGVGRLLGILSLQSLPRRITLDFRDVFSEGFAFDRISGSIEVAAGVMRTEDLEIRGPAARVRMSGSADVEAETQELRVSVQPTLAESVAIGAAAGLLNPAVGVATYLAQKVLSDPIEKLFAYEYDVTGTWADPQVSKRGSVPAPAQAE